MSIDRDYLTLMRPRLNVIQNEFLRDSSHGRMTLSHLRDALDRPVGDDPETARVSLSGIPGGYGFQPFTPLERASWGAFSLYGFHQQGLHYERMQRDGTTFATALRRLHHARRPADAITHLHHAHNPTEAARLLLPAILECHDQHVGFDHALLALDLAQVGSTRFTTDILPSWVAAATA